MFTMSDQVQSNKWSSLDTECDYSIEEDDTGKMTVVKKRKKSLLETRLAGCTLHALIAPPVSNSTTKHKCRSS